jgi:hypothetical protein
MRGKQMTNTLSLVKALDTSTPHSKQREKLKSRRQRRQEERARLNSQRKSD